MDIKRYYKLSEVAELLSLPQKTIIYQWEKTFNIDIRRNKKNRKKYTIENIKTFQYIKLKKDMGWSDIQIRKNINNYNSEQENPEKNKVEAILILERIAKEIEIFISLSSSHFNSK